MLHSLWVRMLSSHPISILELEMDIITTRDMNGMLKKEFDRVMHRPRSSILFGSDLSVLVLTHSENF
jgi:hypothetical protein